MLGGMPKLDVEPRKARCTRPSSAYCVAEVGEEALLLAVAVEPQAAVFPAPPLGGSVVEVAGEREPGLVR